MTYVVHEATARDHDDQVLLAYNRLEILDLAGRVTEVYLRKHRLRWWSRPQFEELLTAAGFVEVSSVDAGEGWVTIGRRAGRGRRRADARW